MGQMKREGLSSVFEKGFGQRGIRQENEIPFYALFAQKLSRLLRRLQDNAAVEIGPLSKEYEKQQKINVSQKPSTAPFGAEAQRCFQQVAGKCRGCC